MTAPIIDPEASAADVARAREILEMSEAMGVGELREKVEKVILDRMNAAVQICQQENYSPRDWAAEVRFGVSAILSLLPTGVDGGGSSSENASPSPLAATQRSSDGAPAPSAAFTPGPWAWMGNKHDLYLATTHSGRRYVMGFRRMGMSSAQPVFRVGERLVPASELVQFEVGDGVARGFAAGALDESVYRYDVAGIDAADARLIAAAPDLLAALIAMVDAECEYMRINYVGDPEKQHNIMVARAAIAKALGREAAGPKSLSVSQDDPVTDPLRATTESGESSAAWRPIESAPKAETDSEPPICLLLAWFNSTESGGRSYQVGEGYWRPEDDGGGAWWWANTTPGDYYTSPIIESITGQITHWMPLPSPPSLGASA